MCDADKIARPALSALLVTMVIAGLLLAVVGCGRKASVIPVRMARTEIVVDTAGFSSEPIGAAFEGTRWIAHVNIVDLDQDGLPDVLACDDKLKAVVWLRQVSRDRFEETVLISGLPSPVHGKADENGAMDIVCVSGFNDWNDPAAASFVAFENDAKLNFTQHVLAREPIQQITCAAGDLDGSDRTSIVAGGFYSYPPFDRMGRITLWWQQP